MGVARCEDCDKHVDEAEYNWDLDICYDCEGIAADEREKELFPDFEHNQPLLFNNLAGDLIPVTFDRFGGSKGISYVKCDSNVNITCVFTQNLRVVS